MPDEEPTLNIPSLLTLAVLSFFVIRWFLKRDGSSGSGNARSRGRGNVDPAQVEQIAQMFPQLSVRDIMWDLQRNGGSAAATTERILTGRGLELAPQSFQPQIQISSATTQTASSSATPSKSAEQDLISRYNLASRVSDDGPSYERPAASPPSVWSNSREERQRLLQKRRDDMILAARRKMMQHGSGSAAANAGS